MRTPTRASGLIVQAARLAIAGSLLIGASVRLSAHHPPIGTPFVDAGTMTLVTWGSDADLDPNALTGAPATSIVHNIAEPLLRFAGASADRYVPVLATHWTVSAHVSVYTFYLRRGVRFHTGRCCLSAQDVQYALARTLAPGSIYAYLLGRFISNPSTQITILTTYAVPSLPSWAR